MTGWVFFGVRGLEVGIENQEVEIGSPPYYALRSKAVGWEVESLGEICSFLPTALAVEYW